MIAGSSLFSLNSFYEICFVVVPHNYNFDLKLTSDAKIQPAITGRETVAFDFGSLLTMVRRWSRSTSNFHALIGQNLTGEFMRKNYAAS